MSDRYLDPEEVMHLKVRVEALEHEAHLSSDDRKFLHSQVDEIQLEVREMRAEMAFLRAEIKEVREETTAILASSQRTEASNLHVANIMERVLDSIQNTHAEIQAIKGRVD
jgi:methyl-accepting chemotaxis protein